MKRLLLVMGLLVLATGAWAASVVLTWNASPTAGVMYQVYKDGTALGSPVAVLTATDPAPPSGIVRYHVKSVSVEGIESDPSNEVVMNLGKPGAPASLRAVFNR